MSRQTVAGFWVATLAILTTTGLAHAQTAPPKAPGPWNVASPGGSLVVTIVPRGS